MYKVDKYDQMILKEVVLLSLQKKTSKYKLKIHSEIYNSLF